MTLLLFLAILSLLILVHELGHFWIARRSGILVDEFGLGLPPRIWGKKIGETLYSLNLLPLGGFVKLFGEDQLVNGQWSNVSGLERAFFAQSKKVRFLVLTAGVVMNFLLGVILFSGVYSTLGIPTETNTVRIVGVVPHSPAQASGLSEGETVRELNGELMLSTTQFVKRVGERKGEMLTMNLGPQEGEGYGRVVSVQTRTDPPEGEGALGVVVSSTEMKHFPWWQMPFRGAWYGLKEAIAWGLTIAGGLWVMLKNLLTAGIVPKDVAGPVGIFQLTGSVAQGGFLSLLQFVGVLSVNLAVLNVLPFPALDGGRLFFLGIETLTGRRVGGKWERFTHAAGMAVLLALMVLITLNDVIRLMGVGSVRGLFERVLLR